MRGITGKTGSAFGAAALLILALAAAQGCSDRGKGDDARRTAPGAQDPRSAAPAVQPSGKGRDVSGVILNTLDGGEKKISDYSGRILVVTFFASWNNASRDAVPIMNELGRKYKNNVTVIGISLDRMGAEGIRTFMNANDVKYEVFMDGSGAAGGFGGARVMPTTYFVLRDGTIHHKIEGLKTKRHYEDIILAMYRMRL